MTQTTTKGAIGAFLLAGSQLAFPAAAHAQDSTLAPSAALSCLTRVAGAPAMPVYPPDLFERKEGDQLAVELEFGRRDEAPGVKFDNELHQYAFRDAVREFVKAYRVPCMADGAKPVVLRQQFVFSPTDGRKVIAPPLSDRNDIARLAQMKCVVHNRQWTRPPFPRKAAQDEREGNLMVRLRYNDPELPPQVVFLTPIPHRDLRRSIESYAEGLRMPCLANGPNEVDILYKFTLFGSARTVLRDTNLVQLLAGSKDFALPATFDFNAMGCPFDVRLTYLRPYMPNKVREIESSNAARRPLLEWMSKITYKFDEQVGLKVLGDSINVTIPCGKLDLPGPATTAGAPTPAT